MGKTKNKKRNSINSVYYNNFCYNLNKKDIHFINNYEVEDKSINLVEKVKLKYDYITFTKVQESKGYETISFEEFIRVTKLCKSNKSSKDLYNAKILKTLSIYLDNLIEEAKYGDKVDFRSAYNYDNYITIKLMPKRLSNENGAKIVKANNPTSLENIEIGYEYSYRELIDLVFKDGYYPSDNNIYEYCRNVSGLYSSLEKFIKQIK